MSAIVTESELPAVSRWQHCEAGDNHVCFNACSPGEPGSTSLPSVFFLHVFQKRTFRDKWLGSLMGPMPFLSPDQQTNSIKALPETRSTEPTTGLASSFLHPLPDPDGRGVGPGPFMSAVCWCHTIGKLWMNCTK